MLRSRCNPDVLTLGQWKVNSSPYRKGSVPESLIRVMQVLASCSGARVTLVGRHESKMSMVRGCTGPS